MAAWRDVRRLALALPGAVEAATKSGNRAWYVNDRLFVWERPLMGSELRALGAAAPDCAIVAVRTPDLELKDVLLASDPAVYFTTPHFNGYPAILIRLPKITTAALKGVIVEAWLARASKRAVSAYLAASG